MNEVNRIDRVPKIAIDAVRLRLTTSYEAAMPSMVTAGALASAHNLAPRLAAAMVGYGLLLSLLSLPLWARLAVG